MDVRGDLGKANAELRVFSLQLVPHPEMTITVKPGLIRHPEAPEKTGFRFSPDKYGQIKHFLMGTSRHHSN